MNLEGGNVVGVGVDLTEVARIRSAHARHGQAFLDKVFTAEEQALCLAKGDPHPSFAARFAAKEAVGKALGIGMTRWHEVEVVRGRGAPTAILTGRCLRRAGDLGVVEVMLSLTHSRGMAAAVAILRGASPRQ